MNRVLCWRAQLHYTQCNNNNNNNNNNNKDLAIEVQLIWNVKTKQKNTRGDWNHLRITQTIPEQHTGKSRH